MAESVASKLGSTPKILQLMELAPEAITEVLAAQKDPAKNPDKLYAAELAIRLNYATPETKAIALVTQAGVIAAAANADLYALKGDHALTGLPAAYYTGKVQNPTAIDAQQATANLAANMVKECAGNRALLSALGPKIEDVAALTKEIQKHPQLSEDQAKRLRSATERFAYDLKRLDPARADQLHLDDYLGETTKQVTQGCANSAQQLERSKSSEVTMPNAGSSFDPSATRHR